MQIKRGCHGLAIAWTKNKVSTSTKQTEKHTSAKLTNGPKTGESHQATECVLQEPEVHQNE